MKKTGILMIIIGLSLATFRGINHYLISVEYEIEISSNWDLSEKASTISQKSEYVNKFVFALENAKLNGVNGNLIKKTPSSDFTENFKALKSLQGRLIEISKMDESGFAYQTAIQQITQQEQAEANDMLMVFDNCWTKAHYYTYWNPILITVFILIELILVLGGYFIQMD